MTIVVAGYTGLVGSAIFELLKEVGEEPIGVNSKNVDLLDRSATFSFFQDTKPDLVIDAAALVGGIGANNSFPVEFLTKNLQIQNNLLDAAHVAGVERLVFLASSCIYPRNCDFPIREEYLMSGPLETTNSAYAIAKIAGIELVKSYRKQFGHNWISLLPTNVYGPRDNFDTATGHVLPALINRFSSAKKLGSNHVRLWGTGDPKREYIHSRDLARAILIAAERYDEETHLNIGIGEDLSIRELASLISELVGYDGEISWDTSKPSGTPRKVLDVSRIKSLGWNPEITLKEGIKETIAWFEANS